MQQRLRTFFDNSRTQNILGALIVFAIFAYSGFAVLRAGIAPWAAYWCFFPVCLLVAVVALMSEFWRAGRLSELPAGLKLVLQGYNFLAALIVSQLLFYLVVVILLPVVVVINLFRKPQS